MRRPVAALLPLLAVLFVLDACRQPDPAGEVLALRNLYTAELSGWSWVEGPHTGQALLNIRVTRGTREGLSELTVVVEEVAGDGETVIKRRLETLSVSGLEYDQPRDLTLKLEGVDQGVDEGGFAVFVDPAPTRQQWSDYPELEGFLATE